LHRGKEINPNGPGRFPEQKQNDMETLKYTTREINANYKIKVSGMYEGNKINTLVGVSGLIRLVADIELKSPFGPCIQLHGRLLRVQAPQRIKGVFLRCLKMRYDETEESNGVQCSRGND